MCEHVNRVNRPDCLVAIGLSRKPPVPPKPPVCNDADVGSRGNGKWWLVFASPPPTPHSSSLFSAPSQSAARLVECTSLCIQLRNQIKMPVNYLPPRRSGGQASSCQAQLHKLFQCVPTRYFRTNHTQQYFLHIHNREKYYTCVPKQVHLIGSNIPSGLY